MFEKEIILKEQLAARCRFQCSPARKLPANAGVGLLKVCELSADNRGQVTRSLSTSRRSLTYGISVSALAFMHSPRFADFRWPRGRRRQTTPPHSRSSNRLKQETARPSQFPQDDPSFPAGSGIRASPSSPCRVADVFVDITNRFVWYRCRWVRAWGSRPFRRPAPVLACRHTPGRSSVCHFER